MRYHMGIRHQKHVYQQSHQQHHHHTAHQKHSCTSSLPVVLVQIHPSSQKNLRPSTQETHLSKPLPARAVRAEAQGCRAQRLSEAQLSQLLATLTSQTTSDQMSSHLSSVNTLPQSRNYRLLASPSSVATSVTASAGLTPAALDVTADLLCPGSPRKGSIDSLTPRPAAPPS
jgi:hypothetical protein